MTENGATGERPETNETMDGGPMTMGEFRAISAEARDDFRRAALSVERLGKAFGVKILTPDELLVQGEPWVLGKIEMSVEKLVEHRLQAAIRADYDEMEARGEWRHYLMGELEEELRRDLRDRMRRRAILQIVDGLETFYAVGPGFLTPGPDATGLTVADLERFSREKNERENRKATGIAQFRAIVAGSGGEP
jgi:hypothetical protein